MPAARPYTVYYDGPYSSGEKEFRNWWGSDYKGYHTIRDGITYSMNIVALRCMADTVTPQLGVEYAERLGITSLVSQDQTLSTALGGLTKGVSNLELTKHLRRSPTAAPTRSLSSLLRFWIATERY